MSPAEVAVLASEQMRLAVVAREAYEAFQRAFAASEADRTNEHVWWEQREARTVWRQAQNRLAAADRAYQQAVAEVSADLVAGLTAKQEGLFG